MQKNYEETLHALQKTIRYGSKLCVYDVEFSIMEVDDEYACLVGLEPEEKSVLSGMTMRDVIHPADLERITREVYGFTANGEKYDCKYRLKVHDGSYIWVRDMGEVVKEGGKPWVRSTVVDIDEKEKLIRQRDVTYESVPGGVLFLVIGKDNFYIRDANEHYFEMIGDTRENYLGSSGKYTFPEDLPRLREHLVTQGAKKDPIDFEFRTRIGKRKNVAWHHLVGNYYDIREDGVEYLCIIDDITQKKNAQFELLRERENYRMAMKNTADLMYEYEVDTKNIRLFGQDYMLEEAALCIENNTVMDYRDLIFCSELIYKGDRSKIVSFIRNDIQRYDNIRMLTQSKETGKKYYDYYEFFAYKMYEGNEVARVVGYVKKISYRTVPVSVRQELHQIFDEHIINEYSFVLKIDVKTESFVPYFVDDYGLKDYRGNRYYESFISWWCKNMVAQEQQQDIAYFLSLEQMLRILYSGESKGYRFCQVKGKDQKYRHKVCRFSFWGADLNTIILTVRDVHSIREEENYREQLSQKMLTDALVETKQAIDGRKTFMEYIVKEFIPPVQAIKQLVTDGYNKGNEKDIMRYVNYLSEIVNGMEEYNRLEAPQRRSDNRVNLYQLCTEVCEEERKISLGLDISIQDNISLPENRLYYVQEFRFKEILVNLLGNSIRYAPKGSEIHLFVREIRQEGDKCIIGIILDDQGPVINEVFQQRKLAEIDENDVKTRILALGGTSSSVSLAAKITGLLGGTVEFSQGVVQNSVVEIEIPVHLSEMNEEIVHMTEELANAETSDNFRGEGILLVENIEKKQSLTASLLRINGAKVYTAESGEVALEMIEKLQVGAISFIMVDKELSDMSCYEFARRVKHTEDVTLRRTPIIEMLDGIQTDDTRLGLTSGINALIYKPINVAKLMTIMDGFRSIL
nr:PAS domain-containing protein [Eubacterium sp.]